MVRLFLFLLKLGHASHASQSQLVLRVRHSGGQCTIKTDSALSSLEQLYGLVSASTGAPCHRLLHGFPPTLLESVAELKSGDSLQAVTEAPAAETPPAAPVSSTPAAPAVTNSSRPTPRSAPAVDFYQPLSRSGSVLLRRVVDADNSCLFTSISLLVLRDRTQAPSLRRLIADTVRASPDTYTEAFLGPPTEEYAEWVLYSDSWGRGHRISHLVSAFQD